MIREYRKNGLALPSEVKNRPELLKQFTFYLNAFFELGNDRQLGLELGPIPFTSMKTYADVFGVKKQDFPSFFSIIRQVDIFYLDLMRNKNNVGKPE